MRGVDRVVVRDGDAIGALLTRLGAHESVLAWEERRMRREVRATANRLANFDDANLRRSARAAVAAGARVQRALEILGDEVPEHLAAAGRLRLEHKQASLEELGALADPPLTKDAVAGRIRRLLAMADKRAQDLGIPGTEASLTEELARRPGGLTRRADEGRNRQPRPRCGTRRPRPRRRWPARGLRRGAVRRGNARPWRHRASDRAPATGDARCGYRRSWDPLMSRAGGTRSGRVGGGRGHPIQRSRSGIAGVPTRRSVRDDPRRHQRLWPHRS